MCSWLTIDKLLAALSKHFRRYDGTMVGSQGAVIMLGNSNRDAKPWLPIVQERSLRHFHPGSLQQLPSKDPLVAASPSVPEIETQTSGSQKRLARR